MKRTRTTRCRQTLRTRPDGRSRSATLAGPSLATKGDEVEEWVDLRFFRPIGVRIARSLAGTGVTADQVTLLSLIIGLAAGHLFVYTSPWLNAAGFVLFIISDIFDSADGQLARLRGTSTRFGRALDGTSDAARFINLGVHLLVRLVIAQQWSWLAATSLVVAAAISHSIQSATIDFIRHAFLALAVGRGSELDFEGAEDLRGASFVRRVAVRFYLQYSRRQLAMFPRTGALLRVARDHPLGPAGASAYRAETLSLVRQCAWLGQNFRFLVLGVTAVAGWPAGLLWITVLPMNAVLIWLRRGQERGAERVQRVAMSVSRPAPVVAPARAIGGE
jgi:phosphatidylglycerophosphate synthase